jgi:RNA polymerase subunit RPABC4/transcription elongation factor Spt4
MADIFEKIKDSIDRGVKTVSSRGKELIETSKLKGEIKDIQDIIDRKFHALGKSVFEMLNRGSLNEEELMVDCHEIRSLFKKIVELEEALKKVELEALRMRYGENVIKCPRCEAINKFDAKFCMACGSSLALEVKAESRSCPGCGALVKAEARFCPRCGTRIE